jgi:hypothetical protein
MSFNALDLRTCVNIKGNGNTRRFSLKSLGFLRHFLAAFQQTNERPESVQTATNV